MAPAPSKPVSPAKEKSKSEFLSRLRDLKNEYDDLERAEEKLLSMLARVRREEGCLTHALNDQVFTGKPATMATKATAPSPKPTNQKQPESKASHLDYKISTKRPPPVTEIARTQTTAAPVEETPMEPAVANTAVKTVVSQPLLQRSKRRRVTQSSNQNISQIEANRQRRKEQILARQRLENALFAEDDDDSSSSSTS